jgi:hypothetical protein
LRTLCLDIETTPILCWTWGLWNQNINPVQVVKPSQLLCWAAKWVGESDMEFRGLKPDGRKRMMQRLWKLVDEADVILHYNGQRFDVPRVQREFLELGMLPPSPFKHIDLLKTARRQFRFDSNKLDQVGKQLGLGRKEEHEGFRLWIRCIDGEASAWDRMRRYNERDVRLTEKVYGIFRPWVVAHPSHAAFAGERVCPKCGSGMLERRGYTTLSTGKYGRLHCKTCGAWSRDTARVATTTVTQIAA